MVFVAHPLLSYDHVGGTFQRMMMPMTLVMMPVLLALAARHPLLAYDHVGGTFQR